MYNGKPFFSVIIPTYNRKDFLRIAIDSVISQTYSNYELLIIDDGSRDKTRDMVKKLYKNNKKVKYTYQKHQGVCAARNKALEKARGKFIAFLDSDDRFLKEKLEVFHNYIEKNPQYKVFHSEEIWYRKGKLLTQKAYHKKPSGFVFPRSLKLCCLSMSTITIKKEVFEKIGYFDKKLPACEDYDFWLRTTSLYPVFLIPKCLTIKEGGHIDQLSKKYPAMDKFRIYSLKKILQSKTFPEPNRQLAYKEFKDKCDIYIKGALKRGKKAEASYYRNLCEKLNLVSIRP